jgi:hypothetical protein
MSEEIASTSFDGHLDALGHVDRRRLLLELLDASTEGRLPVDIDRLADGTAEDLRVSMHHVHLPKLDDYGFVDANPDRYTVTTGPRFDEIRPLLELLDANRNRLPDDWLSPSRRR